VVLPWLRLKGAGGQHEVKNLTSWLSSARCTFGHDCAKNSAIVWVRILGILGMGGYDLSNESKFFSLRPILKAWRQTTRVSSDSVCGARGADQKGMIRPSPLSRMQI
jgi:hypothetical protein